MSGEIATITYTEMEKMAAAIAKSGLFGMKTPEQAIALMAISQAEGRHPALAARDYDIIQGRPSKKAEAMMRDFLTSGGKVQWHKLDDTLADATFSHPAGGEIRMSWDMKRATAAGLGGKDMWKKYPRQMLRARVISEGIRTVCPMATSGMYVPEEVQDFDTKPEPKAELKAKERDITPSEPEPTNGDIKKELTLVDVRKAGKQAVERSGMDAVKKLMADNGWKTASDVPSESFGLAVTLLEAL